MQDTKVASDLLLFVIPPDPDARKHWLAIAEETLLESRSRHMLVIDENDNFVAHWSKAELLRSEAEKDLEALHDLMLNCSPNELFSLDIEARQLERKAKIYKRISEKECSPFS